MLTCIVRACRFENLPCAGLSRVCIATVFSHVQVHLRWVQALEAEFFQQGDAERALGLPISPLCDRNKEGKGSPLHITRLCHRRPGV